MPDISPSPIMGLKSTEFFTAASTIAVFAIGLVPAQYAPLVAAVSGLYIASRTLLKVVHAMGYAKSIPDLPALPPLPAGTTQTTITTVPK